MRNFIVFVLSLVVVVSATLPAYATSYIDISVSEVDQGAIRRVWDDNGLLQVGVFGGLEFNIEASSSYPEEVVGSWIYIDGVVTTSVDRGYVIDTYRNHHCCVVFEYDDNTYEKREFDILPSWEVDDPNIPATGAIAPVNCTIIQNFSVAALIGNTFSEEENGPLSEGTYLGCHNEACSTFTGDQEDECASDFDCIDKF